MIMVEATEDALKMTTAMSPHLSLTEETPAPDDSVQVYDPPTRPDGAINVYNYKGQRFLSAHLLETPPPMRWKNFCKPLLRQFLKHHVPIKWHGCVGCGVEGGVFKVFFGDDGPYALKLFWNTRPQEPLNRGRPFVFPFQDEARHVAIIEKIRWAVQHSENPIMVHPSPKSSELKLENLYCFSEEGQRSPPEFESSIPMCSADYINRCHGWLKLDKKDWPKNYVQCEWRGRPYSPEQADYRWAIVYDYVSSNIKEHDLNVTQANIDFFYLTGFEFAYCKPDNWRQGKLVDFGDLYSPFKRIVQVTPPRRWSAETWLKDKPVKPLTWWTSGAIRETVVGEGGLNPTRIEGIMIDVMEWRNIRTGDDHV